jgi:hypothetical protein
MTITEMRERADRALKFFIQTMPDMPFGEDDIVFDFAPPNKMALRYKALCEAYRPRGVILKEHEEQLADGTGGQAVIGEDKSAILICTKQPFLKANKRRIIFHELMHIYCAKAEVDGEHFVDIYGSGIPYDGSDGLLRDGYFIWSEFVADYYADEHTRSGKFTFESCRDVILKCLDEVIIAPKDNRRDFEWACLNLLTAYDAEAVIGRLTEPDIIFSGDSDKACDTRNLFNDCVRLLYKQTQTEKPWKITKAFIFELGESYQAFENCHTFYRYEQMGGIENALRAYAEQMKTEED